MTRLAQLALAEFAALKRERGWVDMGDLERAADTAGRPVSSARMQQRLDMQVRHLLIDEFQDTNPFAVASAVRLAVGLRGCWAKFQERLSATLSKASIAECAVKQFRAARDGGRAGACCSVVTTRRAVPACVNAVMYEA